MQTSFSTLTDKSKTAFIIELKKDSTHEEVLKQIKEKRYALAPKDDTWRKLAVGITYDSKQKSIMLKPKKSIKLQHYS